jgi:hypothetical protein
MGIYRESDRKYSKKSRKSAEVVVLTGHVLLLVVSML